MAFRSMLRTFLKLSLVVGLAIGCASTDKSESTGQYVDSVILTTKVKSELAQDKRVDVLDVNVKTYKGRVQLSGFVDTWGEKLAAGSIASEVPGVVDVENDLEVR